MTIKLPNHQVETINIGGLKGRLLHLSPKTKSKNKQILLIYGMHSSLERMYSTALFLNRYGEVTLPDLPGIGGMEPFYKINKRLTLDNYADYLYTILKSRKLVSKVDVVAMSFGFMVLTRMLQKYPETEAWFDNVISFVGFGQANDFQYSLFKRRAYIVISDVMSTRLGGWIAAKLIFNPLSLRLMFRVLGTFNPKYQYGFRTDPEGTVAMELDLWQKNDARTRFAIYKLFFEFNLCNDLHKIKVPLLDLTTPNDQYLDPKRVQASLRAIYTNVESARLNSRLHAPSVIGTESEVAKAFPEKAKQILSE